jgi:hypothetical protein
MASLLLACMLLYGGAQLYSSRAHMSILLLSRVFTKMLLAADSLELKKEDIFDLLLVRSMFSCLGCVLMHLSSLEALTPFLCSPDRLPLELLPTSSQTKLPHHFSDSPRRMSSSCRRYVRRCGVPVACIWVVWCELALHPLQRSLPF